jgi:hypothetical protein
MQTAKTLDRGEQEPTLGAVGNYVENEDFGTGLGPDIMYRSGVAGKVDLGFAYAPSLTIGNFRADMKYNLYKSPGENTYISTLLSLEAHNASDPYSGLAFIASFNHQKNFHPYVFQKITFGLRDTQVFQRYSNVIPITSVENYKHNYFLIGGLGFQYQLEKKPNTQFFIEAGYNILKYTSYQNSFLTNDLEEKEWYIYKFKSNRFNAQITFGFNFRLKSR